ncbi:MAG: hypothetical protein IV104_10680 [Acidovorax sp.]|nr:hypothetical protein [Acidovorax sp.]
MGTHPAIDLDVTEAAECGLFTVPELVARKRGGDLERFNLRVAALAGRDTLDLRASVETCSDPALLLALHMELMRRGVPPVLRGPRPWHLGLQGRFVEFASDLAWIAASDPGHRGRYGLARAILKSPSGSSGWWRLVLRQFGRSGNVRGLVLALGLSDEQRRHLRTVQTACRARLFERLHGDGFGQLVDCIETALRVAPDKSGRTNPQATATRRAQLWRVHRLTAEGAAGTAHIWARLSGEVLARWQVARQLAAVEDVALAFERTAGDVES